PFNPSLWDHTSEPPWRRSLEPLFQWSEVIAVRRQHQTTGTDDVAATIGYEADAGEPTAGHLHGDLGQLPCRAGVLAVQKKAAVADRPAVVAPHLHGI